MQRIPIVINSYLNLKTYSITFINCLYRIVRWKLDKMWESWKRSKASWMGHGAWMGIAWGNMGDGRMGLKHSSQNVTCFGGICFGGRAAWESKCVLGHSSKLDMFRWVVSFEVLVLRLTFCDAQFLIDQNKCWVAIETWHVSMLICSKTLATRVWKPMSGHLKANDTFTTCH